MRKKTFTGISLVLILFSSLSCGIKKPPEPLPEPQYILLRIGAYVYVIPEKGRLIVDGFQKIDDFFVKRLPYANCFVVKHPLGKERRECVQDAWMEKPSYRVHLHEESVQIVLEEGRAYRLYDFDEVPLPHTRRDIACCRLSLRRDFTPKRVAITVVSEGVESEPAIVEIPPKKPPKPPKPTRGGYKLLGETLYLFWWADSEDIKGFIVYRNGTKLTPKPIRSNYYREPAPKEVTLYRVFSVNEFGTMSDPLIIHYRP